MLREELRTAADDQHGTLGNYLPILRVISLRPKRHYILEVSLFFSDGAIFLKWHNIFEAALYFEMTLYFWRGNFHFIPPISVCLGRPISPILWNGTFFWNGTKYNFEAGLYFWKWHYIFKQNCNFEAAKCLEQEGNGLISFRAHVFLIKLFNLILWIRNCDSCYQNWPISSSRWPWHLGN